MMISTTVLALLASLAAPSMSAKTSDPFYVIAHMANTEDSLDWSVREGANAIENDIRFDDSGNPQLFQHGGFCDCSCPGHPTSYHICDGTLRNSCTASDGAANHMRRLASLPGIALIIMDSKVDPKWGMRLRTAGTKIVAFMEEHLFGRGYRGNVVISSGKINCYDYVHSAAMAASSSPNRDRYYFSFDQESNNYRDVMGMLSRFTKNRVFGTGISSCVPGNYQSGISQAVNGVSRGENGMAYIWTLDKESSMETYINLGVQGIITNRVGLLKNLAEKIGLRLARPGDRIPVARVNVESPSSCDCDYHKGGCTISAPAPIGKACRCKYKLLMWTCSGSVVGCDISRELCQNPDAGWEACRLGGGDCGGY